MSQYYGQYKVPKTRLGILLDHLYHLNNTFPETSFNQEEFTNDLGLSSGSSGPETKIADMRMFGLLDLSNDGQRFLISPLGKTITTHTGDIRSNAILTAVRKVPLWDLLFDQIGKKITDDILFLNIIKNATGMGGDELQKRIGYLKFAYTNDTNCIFKSPPFSNWSTRIGKPKTKIIRSEDKISVGLTEQSSLFKENYPITGYRVTIEYGGFQIQVKDELTFQIALDMLYAVKKGLQAQGVVFSTKDKDGDPVMGS